jgi:hypothetical protein
VGSFCQAYLTILAYRTDPRQPQKLGHLAHLDVVHLLELLPFFCGQDADLVLHQLQLLITSYQPSLQTHRQLLTDQTWNFSRPTNKLPFWQETSYSYFSFFNRFVRID